MSIVLEILMPPTQPPAPLIQARLLPCVQRRDDLEIAVQDQPLLSATVNRFYGNNGHGIGQQGAATTSQDATKPLVASWPKHNDKPTVGYCEANQSWLRLAARRQ